VIATPTDETPPPVPTATIDGAGLGPQLAPHAGLALIVIAAAALHAAGEATGAETTVVLSTAATALTLGIVVAFACRRRLTSRAARHRAHAFIAVVGVWLTTVTAIGMSFDALGLLAVFGWALSLHWWRDKRIPNRPLVAAELVAPAEDPYTARWHRYLGKDGDWSGSRLEAREDVRDGVIRYVLRLVPGRHTYGKVMGALELIRGVLGLTPGQDIIIERHPVLPSPNLRLTVVTRSPVTVDQVWPGPEAFSPKTGRVNLGPFIDGEGIATWKAYTKNRLWGGYLCGITGTGKSRMIESICLSLAASDTHPTVIMYGDGQGGSSSPLLMRHADYSARTHEQVELMLAGLLLVMALRQDENAFEELEGFTPSDSRPGVLAVVDECHKPLSKAENPTGALRVQYMMSTVAREGGKVGVALVLASQQSTLDAFGGAGNYADALRSNLLAGNGVLFRCKSNNAKTVFGVDIDPRAFPEMPGYAYLIDPEEGARSAPLRGYYVTDEQRKHWPTNIRWRSLETGSASAFGPNYINRHAIAEQSRAELKARIEARRRGEVITGIPSAPDPSAIPVTRTIPAPNPHPAVAQFPIWNPSALTRPAPAPISIPAVHEPSVKVTEAHTRLADAIASGRVLRDGYCKPATIAEHFGISTKWAGILLNGLVAAGVLRKSNDVQGRYYPTGVRLGQRVA